MDQERRTFSYRNRHEGAAGIACPLALFLCVAFTSNALFGIPVVHPARIKPSEFIFIGPCIWGFFAFTVYRSFRFWNERIVIDNDKLAWYGRSGRLRLSVSRDRIRNVEEAFSMCGIGWRVRTDDGDIRFDCRINKHKELRNLLCHEAGKRASQAEDTT